jgi:predicted CXXCH cytochrome family protein
MMKKLAALALAAFASTASATIAGGPHDLSAGGDIGACQYCHAAHLWVQPNAVGGPLWNRDVPAAGSFTVYSSTTLDGAVALGTNSLTCLSCHDGATDMYTVNNGTSGQTPAVMTNTSYALVGTDLRNDHPVGVAYNGASTEYVDPVGSFVGAANLPLYSNRVECGSCHDPHGVWDDTRGTLAMLRVDPSTTDLCAQCHTK